MSTVYIEQAQEKLQGLLVDVSTATDAVTARGDAKATVRALSHCITITQAFAETSADTERTGSIFPVPFNGEVVEACFTVETGKAGGSGYSDYATVTLYKWSADGDGTIAVAAWSGKTDTVTINTSKDLVLTGTAVKVEAGGSLGFAITKPGDGATTGVMTCMAIIQRDND